VNLRGLLGELLGLRRSVSRQVHDKYIATINHRLPSRRSDPRHCTHCVVDDIHDMRVTVQSRTMLLYR
jgi:hypothetical protein